MEPQEAHHKSTKSSRSPLKSVKEWRHRRMDRWERKKGVDIDVEGYQPVSCNWKHNSDDGGFD